MRLNKKKNKTIFVVLLFASWFTTGGKARLMSDIPLLSMPVWPSGKAGKWRDLSSNITSALLSLQKLWSVDTVFRLCPSQLWNIKMALITAHLNAGVILVVTVYDRYIIPPPHPQAFWFLWTSSTMFTYLPQCLESQGCHLIPLAACCQQVWVVVSYTVFCKPFNFFTLIIVFNLVSISQTEWLTMWESSSEMCVCMWQSLFHLRWPCVTDRMIKKSKNQPTLLGFHSSVKSVTIVTGKKTDAFHLRQEYFYQFWSVLPVQWTKVCILWVTFLLGFLSPLYFNGFPFPVVSVFVSGCPDIKKKSSYCGFRVFQVSLTRKKKGGSIYRGFSVVGFLDKTISFQLLWFQCFGFPW